MDGTRQPDPSAAGVEALAPPEELNFVGTGGFQAVGQEFLRYFIEHAGLRPLERVLDVGCGIGRMAIPLTQYLGAEGSYDGFDVVPAGIKWCRAKITPRFPNFRFRLAAVYNEHYAPNAATLARGFRFPYPGASFDLALLTSVFTHMLPADLENYAFEIARVLKPRGRCLVTFFLLNPESQALLERGRGTLAFPPRPPGSPCSFLNPRVPEEAVAYDEACVFRTLAANGLEPNQPVHYGSWCGRPAYLSYQDLVVVHKTRSLTLGQRLGRGWSRLWARAQLPRAAA
jgi:SAM-dependent methyltransferase